MARKVWKFEPTNRWIRGKRDGQTIVDSRRAILMLESPGEADYYFPLQDVRQDFLQESEYAEKSGYRGTRRFWHLQVGDQLLKNAAWTYDEQEHRPDFSGMIAFKWKAMSHWYEEEEQIFLHPRNPYHRVDTIPSSRHVEVFVDGVKVADSERPYLLFETSLAHALLYPGGRCRRPLPGGQRFTDDLSLQRFGQLLRFGGQWRNLQLCCLGISRSDPGSA